MPDEDDFEEDGEGRRREEDEEGEEGFWIVDVEYDQITDDSDGS